MPGARASPAALRPPLCAARPVRPKVPEPHRGGRGAGEAPSPPLPSGLPRSALRERQREEGSDEELPLIPDSNFFFFLLLCLLPISPCVARSKRQEQQKSKINKKGHGARHRFSRRGSLPPCFPPGRRRRGQSAAADLCAARRGAEGARSGAGCPRSAPSRGRTAEPARLPGAGESAAGLPPPRGCSSRPSPAL